MVGVGAGEAARGTLIHHYETDDRGIVNKVNLIVATQHNAAPICMPVKEAAQGLIKGPKVKERLRNRRKMAFRAYDPCLSCATHAFLGEMNLVLNIRDKDGKVI